jgi:uncharacterized protein YbjT (DUF2867 family)
MRILLIGGTGTVGTATAAALSAMGHESVAAARNPGPGGVAMDLRAPERIGPGIAAAGPFDSALLLTPIGPDEPEVGVEAVRRLRAAGVPRIVYLAIMHLEAMRAIPHFETKIPVKAAVLADPRSVVVEANFFMTNDCMVLPAILGAGVYPLPVGQVGVQSVSPGDLGRACARALVMDDWAGQAVPVCGPEVLTGETYAANWSDRLGRPVRYGGDAIAPFLDGLSARFDMDDWLRHDMHRMMDVTQAMGNVASADEAARSEALIGRPAERHRDWIGTLEVTQ